MSSFHCETSLNGKPNCNQEMSSFENLAERGITLIIVVRSYIP